MLVSPYKAGFRFMRDSRLSRFDTVSDFSNSPRAAS
jgi:hypothetical protein